MLAGRNMRKGISRDLGFTAEERSENLRRSAEVAKLINDAGLICIAAFVAPSEEVRQKARDVVGRERFLTVHVATRWRRADSAMRKGLTRRPIRARSPTSRASPHPTKSRSNPIWSCAPTNCTVEQCVDQLMQAAGPRRRHHLGLRTCEHVQCRIVQM